MIINLNFDAAGGANATFVSTMTAAANFLAAQFSDNVTINIDVNYTGTGGGASAGPNGGLYESYTSVYNYLTQNATPGDTTFAALPNSSTIQGQANVAVWDAQLKLMGLISPNSSSVDGTANFATDISPSLLFGVAVHELTHAMGRVPYAGATSQPDIFDMFRYSSPGTMLYSGAIPSAAAYFSINGGVTKMADYGLNSDPSDFLNNSLTAGDPYNEFYNGSTLQTLTPMDLEQMDALGYHLAKKSTLAADSHDFNGDGTADILLQNATNGQIYYANMAGGTLQSWGNLTQTLGWTVMGAGKISGGLDSNVVIENASGTILYGNVVNGALTGWTSVTGTPGYNVVGVGDVTADHHADIVVQSATTGDIDVANMAGGAFSGWIGLGAVQGYSVDAVADINGDGNADIVIQNATTGAILYANMAGGTFSGWVGVTGTPGYVVVGAGDINRDGYADIVVQNQTTGQIEIANMHGGNFTSWNGSVGAAPGYKVIAVEDVTGNGYADIVVENMTNGSLLYADMTTGTFQGWVNIAGVPGFTGHAAPAVDSGTAIAGFTQGELGMTGAAVLGPVVQGDGGMAGNSIVAAVSVGDPGPAGGGQLAPFTQSDLGMGNGTGQSAGSSLVVPAWNDKLFPA